MPNKSDTPDSAIARIAVSQHGILTAKQLAEVGLARSSITERMRSGRLHRLHRGVYAVGHRAPTHHSRWMAAVLACGDGAVLSHHSAAALWELLKPIDGPVHVSIPSTSGRKRRPGIHLHRCASLADPLSSPSSLPIRGGRGPGIVTHRHNIPVTSIQRTTDDLEGTVAPYLLRRAKRQAEHKGVHLRGSEGTRQRSDLEEDFLALFLENGFPHPETCVRIGRHEVDFLWRSHCLVVETDCFLYHRGAVSFHEDRARDLDLRSQGFTVLRFSDRQLESEPERVVAVVRGALS